MRCPSLILSHNYWIYIHDMEQKRERIIPLSDLTQSIKSKSSSSISSISSLFNYAAPFVVSPELVEQVTFPILFANYLTFLVVRLRRQSVFYKFLRRAIQSP